MNEKKIVALDWIMVANLHIHTHTFFFSVMGMNVNSLRCKAYFWRREGQPTPIFLPGIWTEEPAGL